MLSNPKTFPESRLSLEAVIDFDVVKKVNILIDLRKSLVPFVKRTVTLEDYN